MSGRRDIVVVSSVSCIYGMGNPEDFSRSIFRFAIGMTISRNAFLHRLVEILYARTTADFKRGTFRVKGDIVDVYPAYLDNAFRISFFGDEIDEISEIDPISGKTLSRDRKKHTSELQSRENLVCRLLLEKKTACTGRMPPARLAPT